MAILTRSIENVTASTVLSALKSMLGTSWTLSEDGEILWKNTTSAFKIGFTTFTNNNVTYLTVTVITNGAYLKIDQSRSENISSLTSGATVTVYTSPNGSVGVSITNSTGAQLPSLLIVKNSYTGSTMASDFGIAYSASGVSVVSPGRPSALSVADSNGFRVVAIGNVESYALTQATDPITGYAAKDLYWLTAKEESDSTNPPNTLVNGSAKYIRINGSSASSSMYLRYV